MKKFLLLILPFLLLAIAAKAQCPAITCPGDITVGISPGTCDAVVTYSTPQGTDPCANGNVTFTNCAATGRFGPTQVQVDAAYISTPLNNQVTVTTQGIQEWTVPYTGNYTITALGAGGGSYSGAPNQPGNGASIQGTFSLTTGTVLRILVGQKGSEGNPVSSSTFAGGGGGGTFVVDALNSPLLVAGGGNGNNWEGWNTGGPDAKVTNTGTGGGLSSTQNSIYGRGGGGGGLIGNGADYSTSDANGGFSFTNGGVGGEAFGKPGHGGFGGGGATRWEGGGGGGYTGGFSVTTNQYNSTYPTYGAGSYNGGTSQVNTVGVNSNHGQVNITWTGTTATTAQTAGLASGSTFPLGTTVNTFQATDAFGNTVSCSFNVIVQDNENPTITAPSNVTVSSDPGSCDATGVVLGSPVTADNCSVANTTNDAPLNFPIGSTTVTWTVSDASGNSSSATQTVTVQDNENPTITVSNVTVSTDPGSCDATGVGLGSPVTADNCSVAGTINNAPATFPIGNTSVVWTVTDGSGNIATATQIVSVQDNEDPTVTAPSDITVNADAGLCDASGVSFGSAITNDNCFVTNTTNDAPGVFPLGVTTVTWTVTDGAGNTSTAVQLVTVEDNEVPVADTATLADIEAECEVSSLVPPTATDNCSAQIQGTHNAVFPITSNTTITWTYDDGNGNTVTQTQEVIITGLDVSVSVSGIALTANKDDIGVIYQWINCDNGQPVSAASDQTFMPATNGNYAVIITEGNCTDTSACYAVTTIGIFENEFSADVNVYPNPTERMLTIDFTTIVAEAKIQIYDMQGRIVAERTVENERTIHMNIEQAAGLYIIYINSEKGNAVIRLAKTK